MDKIKMPTLRPLPINSHGLSWWGRLRAWIAIPRRWEVVADYYFFVEYLGTELKIPTGFIFDGASIPRLLWPLLSPTGILLIPSLFHDYAYRHKELLNGNGRRVYRQRGQKFYDEMFRRISIQVNGIKTPDFVAWLMLRLFGRFAYDNG